MAGPPRRRDPGDRPAARASRPAIRRGKVRTARRGVFEFQRCRWRKQLASLYRSRRNSNPCPLSRSHCSDRQRRRQTHQGQAWWGFDARPRHRLQSPGTMFGPRVPLSFYGSSGRLCIPSPSVVDGHCLESGMPTRDEWRHRHGEINPPSTNTLRTNIMYWLASGDDSPAAPSVPGTSMSSYTITHELDRATPFKACGAARAARVIL